MISNLATGKALQYAARERLSTILSAPTNIVLSSWDTTLTGLSLSKQPFDVVSTVSIVPSTTQVTDSGQSGR